MARAHQYSLDFRVFRRNLTELAAGFSDDERAKAEAALAFAGDIRKVVDYLIADADAIAAFEADQIILANLADPFLARRMIETARGHDLFHRLGDASFDAMLELLDQDPERADIADWEALLTERAESRGAPIGLGVLVRAELVEGVYRDAPPAAEPAGLAVAGGDDGEDGAGDEEADAPGTPAVAPGEGEPTAKAVFEGEAVEEPPVEEPMAEDPSAEEPSAEDPSAEEPSFEDPPFEEASIDAAPGLEDARADALEEPAAALGPDQAARDEDFEDGVSDLDAPDDAPDLGDLSDLAAPAGAAPRVEREERPAPPAAREGFRRGLVSSLAARARHGGASERRTAGDADGVSESYVADVSGLDAGGGASVPARKQSDAQDFAAEAEPADLAAGFYDAEDFDPADFDPPDFDPEDLEEDGSESGGPDEGGLDAEPSEPPAGGGNGGAARRKGRWVPFFRARKAEALAETAGAASGSRLSAPAAPESARARPEEGAAEAAPAEPLAARSGAPDPDGAALAETTTEDVVPEGPAPDGETPVDAEPETRAPETEEPETEEPEVEEPAAAKPEVDERLTEGMGTEEPAIAAPGIAALEVEPSEVEPPEVEPPEVEASEAEASETETPPPALAVEPTPLERPAELVFWNIGAGSSQLFVEIGYKLVLERLPSVDEYFETLRRLATGERTRKSAIEELAASEEASKDGARWRVYWL